LFHFITILRFSYGDGYQLPEAHVRRMTELNMGTMALTEHGNIDSHTQFERAAVEAGVKPLFGCEIYMPTDPTMEGDTRQKYHLTLIAKDAEGYRNLVALVTESWKDKFGREPTVKMSVLKKYKRGLIVTSGCQGGILHCSTIGGKNILEEDASYRRGLAVAKRFHDIFGDNYCIEVQAFPELEKSRKFNPMGAKMAKALGVRLVGTCDVHYTMLEEAEVQKILHNMRGGETRSVEEMARAWGYDVPLSPPASDKAIYRRLMQTGLTKDQAIEAIVNTELIAQDCTVELPKLDMVEYQPMNQHEKRLVARFGDEWAIKLWKEWLREGWKFRGYDKLPYRQAALDQLKHEMDVIERKGFVHYFLLTAAGVRHLKDKGIPVGPGRGSAAASIAAYILRITEIDPLRPEYGGMLRFERFIDDSREDLPDIDLDFPGTARPILRAFYERMLGPGTVNNVGTFTQFKSRNSLDDAARVFDVPKWDVDIVKNYLIDRANIDLRASSTIADTEAQFPAAKEVFDRHPNLRKAQLLEGNIKGFGVHAAAVILSNQPITDITPTTQREVPKGSGNIISCVGLDKIDAEYRGLLKMDFLGLNTMSVLEDCIKHPEVNMTLNELYALPLDDEKIYDGFCNDDVVSIFQFDGSATRFVNKSVQPRIFRELMDITSLSRPGALHGGSTKDYIAIKNGEMDMEDLHPALTELTSMTQGQIVFQEQILTILRVVGNFPWSSVGDIRRIISKKKGNAEFNKRKEQFMEGASTIHIRYPQHPPMAPEVAEGAWKKMLTSGQYAFNCVTGDTVLLRGCANQHQSQEIRVKDLYDGWRSNTPWGVKLRRQGVTVQQMCDDGQIRPARMVKIFDPVEKLVYEVTTASGRKLRATAEHRLMTDIGYKTVDSLTVGDQLIAMGGKKKVNNRPSTRAGSASPAGGTYLNGPSFQFGDENVAWIDGRTPLLAKTKRWVYEVKAKGRCMHCGKPDDGKPHTLEFAHIITLEALGGDYAKYHHRRNIMLLCNGCHKAFDYKMGMRPRWGSRGRLTEKDQIISIKRRGKELVYDMTMEGPEHNYVTNGLISHNAAHAASYSLISYYTMFFKVYYPAVFYYASLKHLCDGTDGPRKRSSLIIDSQTHGVTMLPVHITNSRATWWARRGCIRPGFEQITGIGDKTAPKLVEARTAARKAGKPWRSWNDITQVKGIGPKAVEKCVAAARSEDPMGVYALNRAIDEVKRAINAGELGAIPNPTHSSLDISDERGVEQHVVWLGTVPKGNNTRNIRDLFEFHASRNGGEELDPSMVKDPALREWVVMRGIDGGESVSIKVTRWDYPRFKDAVMQMKLEKELILVQGIKPSYSSTRQIVVKNLWVIDAEA
jgi:DNA polymerase-3 subunit alpha